MKNASAKRANLLFLLRNMQICDVLRGFLRSQIWIKQPYIRLIAKTIFFGGQGGYFYSGERFSLESVNFITSNRRDGFGVGSDRFLFIPINTQLITLYNNMLMK